MTITIPPAADPASATSAAADSAAETVARALEQLANAPGDYQRPVRTELVARYGVRATQAVIAAHLIESNYGPLLADALGPSSAADVLAYLRTAVAKTLETPEDEPPPTTAGTAHTESRAPARPAAPAAAGATGAPADPQPHDAWLAAA